MYSIFFVMHISIDNIIDFSAKKLQLSTELWNTGTVLYNIAKKK